MILAIAMPIASALRMKAFLLALKGYVVLPAMRMDQDALQDIPATLQRADASLCLNLFFPAAEQKYAGSPQDVMRPCSDLTLLNIVMERHAHLTSGARDPNIANPAATAVMALPTAVRNATQRQ